MLIQHGGQHEPCAIYFPQYLARQLVGGEGDFDILVLVPNSNTGEHIIPILVTYFLYQPLSLPPPPPFLL